MNKISYLIQACRVKQWTKNLLIFVVPFLGFNLSIRVFYLGFLSFLTFCFISSSVYLINDVIDKEDDKLHPVKKNRAIASGIISEKLALIFSIILVILSFLISTIISKNFVFIIFIYLLIQLLYCFKLKTIPIIDIFCISSGFLLRAISGGIASSLAISPWFLLTIGSLSLFLAIEKRKAELRLVNQGTKLTRRSLKRYSIPLLLRLENITANSTFISYALWASGPDLNGAKTSWMLLTVPLVLIGLFRYQLISDPKEIERNLKNNMKKLVNPEKPEEVLINDKGIRLCVFLWLASTLLIYILN